MNSRNIVRLFVTTLILGGLTGGIVGYLARWNEFAHLFTSADVKGILTSFIWLVGVGFIFSVISQAGFFAYLTVHRFGLGLFKSVSLWNSVQVVLMVFVLFDFIYLRHSNAETKGSLLTDLTLVSLIVIIAFIVAYLKMRQTNKSAFIPALFFMTGITIIEWVPVLRTNDQGWLYFMLITLLVCNTYQLLILNSMIEASQKELAAKRGLPRAETSEQSGKEKPKAK